MLDDKWKNLIKETVSRQLPDHRVFIFGSRAGGTSRRYADVDIGLKGPQKVDLRTIFRLKDILAESNIPYLVDVADFSGEEESSFKKFAMRNVIWL